MRRKRLILCIGLAMFLVANAPGASGAAKGDGPAPVAASADRDEEGPDSCCPDRPCGPDCPKGCPYPGGCALCSVAKIPCPAVVVPLIRPDACPDARVAEPPSLYTPPSAGRLIRPPRV